MFKDRIQAGHVLADLLHDTKVKAQWFLAIPRGGVQSHFLLLCVWRAPLD